MMGFRAILVVLLTLEYCFEYVVRGDTSIDHHTATMIYGHVHVAKTGGTELNGLLASKYERVCGNKGYSYDFFAVNKLNLANNNRHHDRKKTKTRGKISYEEMAEIGYEDCDYISQEVEWTFWKTFSKWDVPIELHVPCRDPVDHLMSQCNFRKKNYSCDKPASLVVKDCLRYISEESEWNRFSDRVVSIANTSLKCFDFRYSFTKYLDYLDDFLQRKRLPNEYVSRKTNRPRNRSAECIWSNAEKREELKEFLIQNVDYYGFCEKCIGSSDDLLH